MPGSNSPTPSKKQNSNRPFGSGSLRNPPLRSVQIVERRYWSAFRRIPKACHEVVIHHSHSLHEGVTDRTSDETKAALFQILAHRIRHRRARRDLARLCPRIHSLTASNKLPDVSIKAAEFFCNCQHCLRITDCARNLQPVAHDAFVVHEAAHFLRVVTRDNYRIKVVERGAIVFTLAKNCVPTQAGLRSFQNEELEKPAVGVHGHSPLPVVVTNGQIISCPGTADPLVR